MLTPVCVVFSVLLAWTNAQVELGYYEGDICKQEGSALWTCTRPEKCPKAREDYRSKGTRPMVCSKQGGIPIICCEPTLKTRPAPRKSKSMQMCEKYAESVFITVSQGFDGTESKYDVCAAAEPLITLGTEARPREFPHMAQIGVGEKQKITWVCGGSLISERFVMSAAHCTQATPSRPARWARVGDYNTQTTQDNDDGTALSVEYEIIERINHPQYDASSVYYDIALYRLKEDVEFNEFVRPGCLQTQHYFTKSYALATGWGKTDVISKPSPILLKVNLTLTPSRDCSNIYRSVIGSKLKDGVKDDMQICAGDLKSGKDTCNGDSGGPLQLRLIEPYCMYSIIGIVSFGPKDCGDGSRPGIYTRVSYYVPWIESIVWP